MKDLEGIRKICMYCRADDCERFHVITRQVEIDVSGLTLNQIESMERMFRRDLRIDVFLNAGNGNVVMKVVKYGD